MDQCEKKIKSSQRRQIELNRQGMDRKGLIAEGQRERAQLDSQAGKQSQKLAQASRESHRLWEWLQQNQKEFEAEVFGPPLVTCSIKDPRYLDQIESLLQQSLVISFTVQTKNDFKLLSNIAAERLKLSEVNIKTIRTKLDEYRAPMSSDEMKRYGLDSWAIDFMQGPEPVLAMLCAEIKMHATGVAVRDTTAEQFTLLENSNLQNWVTNQSTYRVNRRREYGAGAVSTMTRPVNKAKFWTDAPVDGNIQRELQEKIDGWQEELAELAREVHEIQSMVRAERVTFTETKAQMVRVESCC